MNYFRVFIMRTSRGLPLELLADCKVGRVILCAPQFSNAKTARRGLTRPTILQRQRRGCASHS